MLGRIPEFLSALYATDIGFSFQAVISIFMPCAFGVEGDTYA
jgi:hypothetical protein